MNYAIIGSGAIGTALARQFARQGIAVAVANTRGRDSMAALADELGPSITPTELPTALGADIVILAVPFDAVARAAGSAPAWNGRLVVDATNAIDFTDFTPADLGGRLSTDLVAEAVPGAKVVKAFNTLPAAILATEPQGEGGRRTIFVSSDDEQAASRVADLVSQLGFAPIMLGKIAEGGRLQHFGGALMVHSLLKQD